MADEDDGFFMSLEQQVFLVECRSVVEIMVDKTVDNLKQMSEEQVHILLLDDCYASQIEISGFQNALATAVLLAAIERKKAKA